MECRTLHQMDTAAKAGYRFGVKYVARMFIFYPESITRFAIDENIFQNLYETCLP